MRGARLRVCQVRRLPFFAQPRPPPPKPSDLVGSIRLPSVVATLVTQQDHLLGPQRYLQQSIAPVVYGGVRRQKHVGSPRLDIQRDEVLRATTRRFDPGPWVVGTFDADERLYAFGCSVPFQPHVSIGWLEEIDPESLETVRRSPDLATGGHNWCGGAAGTTTPEGVDGALYRLHAARREA